MRNGRASVGIVTPTYNQAAFVEQTIESILDQDYPNIRYIVANDGSTDGTAGIISRLKGKFDFVDQSNRGQAATLNEQWAALDTEYLGYLSSDDLLAPDAISRAVDLMESDASIVCVFPDYHVIDENGRVIKRSVGRPFDLEETVVTQLCNIGPGAVFRKSAFDTVGGWRTDIRLAPDWEFWIRLARLGEIRFLEEPLGFYRLHTGSYSVKEVSTERSLEYVNVLNDYFSASPPDEIAMRRAEAYANAYSMVARNAFRRGSFREGVSYLRLARSFDRRVTEPARLIKLGRHIVSKPLRIMAGKLNRLGVRR